MAVPFPNIGIGEKSKRKVGFRILRVDFGDGYSQSMPDGINNALEEWDLSFENYPAADVDTITDFLDSLKGSAVFSWTPPGEASPKLWRQEGEYDVAFNGPSTKSLGFAIKRVFIE